MVLQLKNAAFLLTVLISSTQLRAQRFLHSSASIGLIGDSADVKTETKGGIVLIGGGGEVESAFRWMINNSGGGDVVVITASDNSDYDQDIFQLGGVNSVETLNITSHDLGDNDTVANIIRNAEMLFIAGGDQSRYMNFWRGTKTQAAINYLMNVKKVPVGGTSAGCAILSGMYFSGEKESVVSDEVLNNPYIDGVTLYNNDLLHAPFLQNVITDQHYLTRKREGRHVAFMARIIKDWNLFPKGIAPNERTAVCIDEDGNAKVFGESKAYFISSDSGHVPEAVAQGKPLQWITRKKALHVYEIQGSATGAGSFSVADFNPLKASGGSWYWWWVADGKLNKEADADLMSK
ncbi:MAG: cyanophycinase [Ginsengibacter sp.]